MSAVSPTATAATGRAGSPISPQLVALCFGNFIIGTGALIVPGMLPSLAEGLGVSLPQAGQLITVFAVTVALTAPLLSGLTSRFDRRNLIVAVQLLYFAGHAAAALVSTHGAMLVVRAVTSVSAGLYVAQAAATAALLSPSEHRGRAMAFVFLGWSIAAVVGLPLGAYVGASIGWRMGFALVAAGSLASALWLRWVLPDGLFVKPMDRAMWGQLFRHPAILPAVGVTALSASAQFVLFAYFVSAAHTLVNASAGQVSLLIACYGATGVAGNAVCGSLCDRYGPGRIVLLTVAVMLAAQFIWPWSPGSMAVLALAMAVMGLGGFASNSAQQVRLAALSPALAPVSVAFNSSAIYVGQAAGTSVASGVLAHQNAGAGGVLLGVVVALLSIAAAGLVRLPVRRSSLVFICTLMFLAAALGLSLLVGNMAQAGGEASATAGYVALSWGGGVMLASGLALSWLASRRALLGAGQQAGR
jgi:predicted MFS family arabinose efflux permease